MPVSFLVQVIQQHPQEMNHSKRYQNLNESSRHRQKRGTNCNRNKSYIISSFIFWFSAFINHDHVPCHLAAEVHPRVVVP